MTTQPSSSSELPPPRSSATVLVLRNDPFEVLMVGRGARGAFASALVFPGGAIDPDDADESWRSLVADFDEVPPAERALRIGAMREVWEETGILLPRLGQATAREGSFRDTVESTGVRLQLQSLTHFGHWVTPVEEPRRFDTHFFLAEVDRDTVAEPDGRETIEAEWLTPSHAAHLAQSGERPIIFPTMLNLLRLAESDSAAAAIAAARARPRVTVAPVMCVSDDGTRHVRIPAEAGYPVLEWSDRR